MAKAGNFTISVVLMAGATLGAAKTIRVEIKTSVQERKLMKRNALKPIALMLMLFSGCSGGLGSSVVVAGTGSNDLLKLRAGPGLGFRVILGLPDGTQLIRRDCVTEAFQRWCEVSLSAAPSITGYVSADYLVSP